MEAKGELMIEEFKSVNGEDENVENIDEEAE